MAKSDIGRDKLQRTKERLDLKTAQIGERMIGVDPGRLCQEQSRTAAFEVFGDVTELVGDPQESREDASHPADDGRLAKTPVVELEDRAASSSDRRFRTRERAPSTKRRGPNGNMEDSESRCTADSPDIFGMAANDSGLDIDYMNEIIQETKNLDDIHKRIISSCIRAMDIMEVYSPARVSEVVKR